MHHILRICKHKKVLQLKIIALYWRYINTTEGNNMKLQPGDYVSTQGMTEKQYHAIAKRFIEAGAHPNEHCSYKDPLSDWIFIGWMHGCGFAHWNNPDEFCIPNRLLTIDQILSDQPEWDGTGLPPVGAVVEYALNGSDSWFKCEIISHDRLVIQCPHLENECCDGLQVIRDEKNIRFRPIRSDRDKAIDDLVSVMVDHYADPKGAEKYIRLASKLYDAGYRKQADQ